MYCTGQTPCSCSIKTGNVTLLQFFNLEKSAKLNQMTRRPLPAMWRLEEVGGVGQSGLKLIRSRI